MPHLQDVLQLAARGAGRKIRDRLLMVPAREHGRNREELPLMRKRRLRPTLYDDVVRLLVVRAISLLILDRRKRPSEDLGLTRLIASANSKFEPTAAQHVEHRSLLRNSHRMPPGHDIGGLPKANLLGTRGDSSFRQQRIGTELGAFGLKVMFRHEEIVEAEFVREDALANLADQRALTRFVNFGEVAVVNAYATWSSEDREIARAVVEYSDFDHRCLRNIHSLGSSPGSAIFSRRLSLPHARA